MYVSHFFNFLLYSSSLLFFPFIWLSASFSLFGPFAEMFTHTMCVYVCVLCWLSACLIHAYALVIHHNEIVRISYRNAYVAGHLKVRHIHKFPLTLSFSLNRFCTAAGAFFFVQHLLFLCDFVCKSFILPFIKPIFCVLCGISLSSSLSLSGRWSIACLPKAQKQMQWVHNAIILSIFNSICSNIPNRTILLAPFDSRIRKIY